MKLKKLGFMNIKKEDILCRDEMKTVLAGSGGAGYCYCETDDCAVEIFLNTGGWEMQMHCGSEVYIGSGSGPYGGTICHGYCP